MTAQHVEVRWELDGRPVWWGALMRQEPDGAAELDYVRRGDVAAHRTTAHVLNDRELLDLASQSVLRWRRARRTPTFTAADMVDLEASMPDEAPALDDAHQQLQGLSAAHRRRLQGGMARFQAVVAAYLASLPPGHVVTPDDIAAATAELR